MTANPDIILRRHSPSPARARDPSFLLAAATAALSPRALADRAATLFEIAPNPFEQGRKNQTAAWLRNYNEIAHRLIWC